MVQAAVFTLWSLRGSSEAIRLLEDSPAAEHLLEILRWEDQKMLSAAVETFRNSNFETVRSLAQELDQHLGDES